jgi:hypothetical protein
MLSRDDIRRMLDANRVEVNGAWKDEFVAFKDSAKAAAESERREREIWQKKTDDSIDKQSRTFSAWTWVFQGMTAFCALLAGVGIFKFTEWSNLADQMHGLKNDVSDSLKNSVEATARLNSISIQLDRFFAGQVWATGFGEIDDLMEWLSPSAPTGQLVSCKRRAEAQKAAIDAELIAFELKSGSDEEAKSALRLLSRVNQLVIQVIDICAIVKTESLSTAVLGPADTLERLEKLNEIEHDWQNLSIPTDFPEQRQNDLMHLDAYRDYVFGVLEALRLRYADSEDPVGEAEKHFADAAKKHMRLSRAYVGEGGLRLWQLRARFNITDEKSSLSSKDMNTCLDELDKIGLILRQCLTVSSQPSPAAAAHSNLATAEWCRASILWKMERKEDAIRVARHALYEAELAQKYPDAPQESFITGAEIICVLLRFEASENSDANRAQADQKWPEIQTWLEDAVYAGWSRPASTTKLLEYCPPLTYLNGLGTEFQQRLTLFCNEK